jgi:hypothetical protein
VRSDMRRKRIGLISLLVAGLFVTSGIAAATEHEDTTFNYGYDSDNRLLLINTIAWGEDVEATDAPCQLDTDLTDDTGTDYPVTYTPGDPIEVDPLELDGESCELQAAEVSGPNGQINHGMIMKAFKTLYDGARRGCVNRYLAQSDFGKGEQQIQAGEEDSTFEPALAPATVEFFTALADCERGDDEIESEIEGQGNGNGKGKGKGRPDSPGKSGSAPGRAGR